MIVSAMFGDSVGETERHAQLTGGGGVNKMLWAQVCSSCNGGCFGSRFCNQCH